MSNTPVYCLEDWNTAQSPSISTEVPRIFLQPFQTIAVIVALFEAGKDIIILYPFQCILPYLLCYIIWANDTIVKEIVNI
jgi:hypothetical protein